MIKAVVFDMDGLLIDSEPLWAEAMAKVFKKVNMDFTQKLHSEIQGLRSDEIVKYCYKKYPWKNSSLKKIEEDLLETVINLIKEKGEPKEGTEYILKYMKAKNLKIALSSSSPMRLIKTAIKKLNIDKYFDELYSAEFEKYGKPHPGVYITAAKKLGISTNNCLAFEDSFNGLLSAKSAGMKCVLVPDKLLTNKNKLAKADKVINSLLEFDENTWNWLE